MPRNPHQLNGQDLSFQIMGASTGVDIIIKEPKEYYTNGDIIRGDIILKNRKAKQLKTVKVALVCQEKVSVNVNKDGKNKKKETAAEDLHRLDRQLFPDTDLVLGLKDPKFKFQTGEHVFEFELEVPSLARALPASCMVDDFNGILWFIEAKIDAKGLLGSQKADSKLFFEMQSSQPVPPPNTNQLEVGFDERSLTVFNPGFDHWQRSSLSSKLKSIVPGTGKFRIKTVAILRESLPKYGVLQGATHPIELDFSFEFTARDITDRLMIRGFRCTLKQKFTMRLVKKDEEKKTETRKKEYEILSLPHVAWDFDQGVDQIKDMLSQMRITDRLPETRVSRALDVQYKFAIEVHVASKERADNTEKFRVSIPIHLHRFVANESAARREKATVSLNSPPQSPHSGPPERSYPADEKRPNLPPRAPQLPRKQDNFGEFVPDHEPTSETESEQPAEEKQHNPPAYSE